MHMEGAYDKRDQEKNGQNCTKMAAAKWKTAGKQKGAQTI